MEVEGAHSARTMSINAAELKQLLQSKEESPENLFLELEKLVLVKKEKQNQKQKQLLPKTYFLLNLTSTSFPSDFLKKVNSQLGVYTLN